MQAVQAPQIAQMLAGAAQGLIQSQVGPVNRFRLLQMTLLHQQSAQGVPRGLHPAPGFIIGQGVVQCHRLAQMVKGGIKVAASVFQFAVQHRLGDGQQINHGVVVHPAALWHLGLGHQEGIAGLLCCRDVAHSGIGHRLGVPHHRRGRTIELLIRRQVLLDDVLPFAKADQDMLFHRDIAFDEIRHGRRGHPEQIVRRGVDQLLRRLDGGGVLAQEHGAVDGEMIIVGPIGRVQIQRPFLG